MLGIGVILPVGLLVLTLIYMKEPKKVDNEIIDNIHITFDSEIGGGSSKKTLFMGFLMETVLAFILQFTGIFFMIAMYFLNYKRIDFSRSEFT